MYRVIKHETIAPAIVRVGVLAPLIARAALPGQFIILRVTSDGERIPLTISDCDAQAGIVEMISQTVGATTRDLAALKVGDDLADIAGPLGKPSEFFGAKRVICVGGGVGTAVLLPQARHLFRAGTPADIIIGARSGDLLILEDELRPLSRTLTLCTDDGSYGMHGRVTDALLPMLKSAPPELCVAIGPPIMMKFVCEMTRGFGVKTIVSLNPLMVDGTGMCGCCRVTVDGKTQYACVDGPDFDGHLVDFDGFMQRLGAYKDEEAEQNQRHPCGGVFHGAH